MQKIWLQGNPIFCNCEITWMIEWLGNYGRRVVQGVENIICAKGMKVGKPIYLLKPYNMGCYDEKAGMWIAIGTIGGLITLMVLAVAPISRYMDFRWLLYRNLGILVGNPDENEDLNILQYDAFLSYR